jgi:hypothetical protein
MSYRDRKNRKGRMLVTSTVQSYYCCRNCETKGNRA